MELLKFVRLSVVLVSMVSGERFNQGYTKRLINNQVSYLTKDSTHERMKQGQSICLRLSKEPYFWVEMLLGTTWRTYYSWNIDFQNQCVDMVFRNATPSIINRVHNAMSDFLKSEPNWAAATLLVSMGRATHEMLLCPDKEATGRFQGVPNIIADGSPQPAVKSVQLLNVYLKLMYGGKYLLLSDCEIGVTTLSANRRMKPYRAEIAGIANTLDFGPGQQACIADKNRNEFLPKQ